jgi:hypothetical protein
LSAQAGFETSAGLGDLGQRRGGGRGTTGCLAVAGNGRGLPGVIEVFLKSP